MKTSTVKATLEANKEVVKAAQAKKAATAKAPRAKAQQQAKEAMKSAVASVTENVQEKAQEKKKSNFLANLKALHAEAQEKKAAESQEQNKATTKAQQEKTRAVVVLFSKTEKTAFVSTNICFMNKTVEQLKAFTRNEKTGLYYKPKCVKMLDAEDYSAVVVQVVEKGTVETAKATVCNKLKEIGYALACTSPKTSEVVEIATDFAQFKL